MDRRRVVALIAVVAVVAVVVLALLTPPYDLGPPPTCSFELAVQPLNTTAGWFYVIEAIRGNPQPLSAYHVTLFVYGTGPSGETVRVVGYGGPLPTLSGASGNLTFADRGAQPGYLDAYGDYFWAETWHVLEIDRAGRVVGGTLGCV